ncbi:MAG TPA: ferrochelatase, partial [Actinomycetota bacterium]|nr:ferrochelatase [Actinomycetota bacterium]
HSPPFVGDVVQQMAADGIREGLGLVMAPHFARMSIGGYMDRARKALPDDGSLKLDFIESWHTHPTFIELLVERVQEARDRLTEEERARDLVVFSAHSLPARIADEGDPYPKQLQETADAVALALGLEHYTVAWQSAGRTDEPWLGPSLDEVIGTAAAEGHAAVVSCPCGFVADHLEILYDIDIEAQRAAAEAGIRLVRAESMNDDPAFITALANVVRDYLKGAA